MPPKRDYFRAVKPAPVWIELIRDSALIPSKKLILTGVITLAAQDERGLVARKALFDWIQQQEESGNGKGIGKTRQAQLIEELTEEGAFDRQDVIHENITIYVLTRDITSFLVTASRRVQEKQRQSRRGEAAAIRRATALERQNIMALSGVEFLDTLPATYYGERLMHGILDAAVRSGRSDRRREIQTRYGLPVPGQRKMEWLDIRTLCRSNEESAIFELSDLAVVTALNSRFVDHIQRKYGANPTIDSIPNLFVFDILSLCEELGLPPKMRDLVGARLRRLRDTVFQINVTNAPAFRQAFGYEGRSMVEYQYLTEFEVANEQLVEDLVRAGNTETLEPFENDAYFNHSRDMFSGEEAYLDTARMQVVRSVPRLYYVKFNSRMFTSLIEQARTQRFILHPELMQERLGIVHRFYNWAKAYVGVRPRHPRPEVVQFLLDEFQEVCLPSGSYTTFQTDIVRMAQKYLVSEAWDEQGNNRSLVHGYFLEVDYSEAGLQAFRESQPKSQQTRRYPGRQRTAPVVRISRNPQDPLIGDNSAHNLALRQQRLEALYEDDPAFLQAAGRGRP